MDMEIPAFIWADLKAVAGGPLEALAYISAFAITVLAVHHTVQFAIKRYSRTLDTDLEERIEALELTAAQAYAMATQAERDVLRLRREVLAIREQQKDKP